jgi:hypothetical protein
MSITNYHLSHSRFAELTAEVSRLRPELARVRGERDRLVALCASRAPGGLFDRPASWSIARVLERMTVGDPPAGQVFAALAEHDRRAAE